MQNLEGENTDEVGTPLGSSKNDLRHKSLMALQPVLSESRLMRRPCNHIFLIEVI